MTTKLVYKFDFAPLGSYPSEGEIFNWEDYLNSTPLQDLPFKIVLFVTEEHLRHLENHPDVLSRVGLDKVDVGDKVAVFSRSLEHILGVNLISIVENPEEMRTEVWCK